MKAARSYRWFGVLVLTVLGLLLLLPLATGPTPLGGVLRCLPLGWLHFLQRNIPEVTFNWSLILTGVICSCLVVVLGNLLLRAVFTQVQCPAGPGQPVRRWPWRWTLCIYALVWLLFMIAFGAAGVFRHTAWLIDYRGPWYRERLSHYSELRQAELTVHMLIQDEGEDLEQARKAFYSAPSEWQRTTLLADEFNVIFYGNSSNNVAAYLIIPRAPESSRDAQFVASIPGENELFRPLSELPSTVARLDNAYPHRDQH